MTFHIGQKVVCVDARAKCDCGCATRLVTGQVYTVRAVFVLFGNEGIHVEETSPLKWTSGYASSRFRPVVEKKTDISVFTEILNRESKSRVMAPSINEHTSLLNQI